MQGLAHSRPDAATAACSRARIRHAVGDLRPARRGAYQPAHPRDVPGVLGEPSLVARPVLGADQSVGTATAFGYVVDVELVVRSMIAVQMAAQLLARSGKRATLGGGVLAEGPEIGAEVALRSRCPRRSSSAAAPSGALRCASSREPVAEWRHRGRERGGVRQPLRPRAARPAPRGACGPPRRAATRAAMAPGPAVLASLIKRQCHAQREEIAEPP